MRFLDQVARPVGRPCERQEPPTFQDAIEECLGEVVVVEHLSPLLQALVGGEDDGPVIQVAPIDDAVDDVGSVIDVGEIANLVDDQHVGLAVGDRGLGQAAFSGRYDEIVDQGSRGSETGIKAALDGADGNGDGQCRLTSTGLAAEDEVAAFGHEFAAEVRSQEIAPQSGTECEVEFLDGLEECGPDRLRAALAKCVARGRHDLFAVEAALKEVA